VSLRRAQAVLLITMSCGTRTTSRLMHCRVLPTTSAIRMALFFLFFETRQEIEVNISKENYICIKRLTVGNACAVTRGAHVLYLLVSYFV
jgi:hypothetical protein